MPVLTDAEKKRVIRHKLLAAAALVALCVVGVRLGRLYAVYFKPPVKIEAKYQRRAMGSPKADLWIVEFVDFQCEICAKVKDLMQEYWKKYPGRIYLQVRFDPLVKNHPHALQSAIFAECAARQNKFWPVYETLYGEQAQWAKTADPAPWFESIASRVGLDRERAKACARDPRTSAGILEERSQAQSVGVARTPTFFFNGKKIEGIDEFRKALEAYFKADKP